MRRKNKGIVLTISAVIEGLFVTGVLALLYWMFLSRVLEVHVVVSEMNAERHAINLANVLISSEKLAYEKDGKISRGILDSTKLDNVFINKREFLSDVRVYLEPKDIGIGYPNTLNLVWVLDLDSCQDSDCDGWMASLSGPVTLEGLKPVKFTECLAENVKLDQWGSNFRFYFGGIFGALWQPQDIEKCIKNANPLGVKSFFTWSAISSSGLPVLIRYPDGDLHIGRIKAGVGEWA